MMRTPSAKTAVTADKARVNVRTPIRTPDLSALRAANLTVGVALTGMRRVAENVTHNLRCSHSKLTAECYDLSQGSQPHLMGRFTRTALAALLVSVVVAPHAFAQQELTFSLFERYIDALQVQANIPGMSAAIVQNERVTWTAGFGMADIERSIAARPDTPYHISGLTEALSSALLMEQCVETAHAALDERIQLRVTAYGESNTTMRDLLSHKSPTSGFKYDAGRYAAGLTPLAEDCVGQGTPFRQALWEKV